MKSTPKYVLVFYIYECIYVLFWILAPHISSFTLANSLLLYAASTIVAVGWIGYMAYRVFVKKDDNVNLFVLFGLVLFLSAVSNLK